MFTNYFQKFASLTAEIQIQNYGFPSLQPKPQYFDSFTQNVLRKKHRAQHVISS